jgi:hypothetical protein
MTFQRYGELRYSVLKRYVIELKKMLKNAVKTSPCDQVKIPNYWAWAMR